MTHASVHAAATEDPPQASEPRYVRIWKGIRDPIALLTRYEATFGDIVTLRRGFSYAVFRPDYIKHVLQDNHPNYEKGQRYRSALSPLMGNGLFTSEGSFWLRQRRLAQRAFERAHLSAYEPPIHDCMSELLDRWHAHAGRGDAIALREELTDVTLRITLRIIFSTGAVPHMPSLIEAVQGVNQELKFGSQFLPFHLPGWIPTPKRRRFSRSLRTIDDFVYAAIANRRTAPDKGSDLVGLLLQAQEDTTDDGMTDLQLRDELVTFLNAGHDTVTDAVLWTLVLLARHPEAKQKARLEISEVAGSGPLSVEAINNMPYLGRVFHESLRLYPPAWAFGRTAIADDRIGGYRIPAGALVVLSPYVTHRSPRVWDRAEAFDPDRFLPVRTASRPKFAYFPFGAGPRKCIGAGIAMIEAPLILASILQQFDFDLVSTHTVKPAPRISLRPEGTVRLRLRPVSRT